MWVDGWGAFFRKPKDRLGFRYQDERAICVDERIAQDTDKHDPKNKGKFNFSWRIDDKRGQREREPVDCTTT